MVGCRRGSRIVPSHTNKQKGRVMRLMRLGQPGAERPVVRLDDTTYIDVSDVVTDYNEQFFGSGALDRLRPVVAERAADPTQHKKFAGERIGAPFARPHQILCIGLNYSDHAAETGQQVPDEPILFTKSPNALIGPNDEGRIPRASEKTDWEVELGIVIGRRTSYLASESEAQDCIAGFVLVNDVSERAFQTERGGQWSKGKSCETFNPAGPWLSTQDEIADVLKLGMSLDVNGVRRQTGSTSTMIFNPYFIVHYLSQFLVLEPGDLINTGTPPGVGLGFNPPIYLKPGDVMELSIDCLGTQRRPVLAPRKDLGPLSSAVGCHGHRPRGVKCGAGWCRPEFHNPREERMGTVRDTLLAAAPGRVSDRISARLAKAHDASHYLLVPEFVVTAVDTADIAGLTRACATARGPLTFRAGGTSLSGQAASDSVLVDSRAHFRGIEVLDSGARGRAQPGATVRAVNARLAAFGRKLGPDPASESAATIRGVVANNSNGMACGTEFNAYQTLESVVLVLANGVIIDTSDRDADSQLAAAVPEIHRGLLALRDRLRDNPASVRTIKPLLAPKNTMGYGLNSFLDADRPINILTRLVIGSEGTLAFVASATFRTVPLLRHVATGLMVFDDLQRATSVLPDLVADGFATVELLDATSLRVSQRDPQTPASLMKLTVAQHSALLIEHQAPDASELADRVAASTPLPPPPAPTEPPRPPAFSTAYRTPGTGCLRAGRSGCREPPAACPTGLERTDRSHERRARTCRALAPAQGSLRNRRWQPPPGHNGPVGGCRGAGRDARFGVRESRAALRRAPLRRQCHLRSRQGWQHPLYAQRTVRRWHSRTIPHLHRGDGRSCSRCGRHPQSRAWNRSDHGSLCSSAVRG